VQVDTMKLKQMLQPFLVYFCVFCPTTALSEGKMFALKGVWPAIGTIAVRGLVNGVVFALLLLFLQRIGIWPQRRTEETGELANTGAPRGAGLSSNY
jgi:hypothetical protein